MMPQEQPAPPQQPQKPQEPPVTIDQVVQLLRDQRVRGFRIDVETDQLAQPDDDAEKQRVNEFLGAITQYIGGVGPIVKEMPPLAKMFGSMLTFAVRRYRVGRELEETIEQSMEEAGMALANPPPPQPTPDEQIKLEGLKVKAQAEAQKSQTEAQSSAIEAQQRQQESAQEAQIRQMESEREAEMAQAQHQLEMQKMLFDAKLAEMEHAHKVQLMALQKDAAEHQAKLAKEAKPKGDD